MVTYRVLEAQAQSWPESYGAQHSWCQIDKPLIFCTKAKVVSVSFSSNLYEATLDVLPFA